MTTASIWSDANISSTSTRRTSMRFQHQLQVFGFLVAHAGQQAHLVEVSDQVAAPIPASDNADPWTAELVHQFRLRRDFRRQCPCSGDRPQCPDMSSQQTPPPSMIIRSSAKTCSRPSAFRGAGVGFQVIHSCRGEPIHLIALDRRGATRNVLDIRISRRPEVDPGH